MTTLISIVNPASITVAKAMVGLAGAGSMVIGTGLPIWDNMNPIPQPEVTQAALFNQFASTSITAQYLDSAGAVTGTPTGVVLFTGTFGLGAGNGTIREIGIILDGRLFGALNIRAITKPTGSLDYSLTKQIKVIF